MAKSEQPISELHQFWLDHVKAADASNDSRVVYAAEHDLKVQHLYQWKTALRRLGLLPGSTPKPSFVAVGRRPVPVPPTSCNLILPNGVRLQFAGDATLLSQILSAAHSLS